MGTLKRTPAGRLQPASAINSGATPPCRQRLCLLQHQLHRRRRQVRRVAVFLPTRTHRHHNPARHRLSVSRNVYCSHMRRTQIYITEEQAARIHDEASARGISQAQVIRQILDDALHTGDPEAEADAAILATAGILRDAPDWREWQATVRGRSADKRLKDSGL